MNNVRGVVHAILKCAVEMGEGFGTASEAHPLAKVVATTRAVIAVVAHYTSLDGDSLAYVEVSDTGTDSSHNSCRFVAKNQR